MFFRCMSPLPQPSQMLQHCEGSHKVEFKFYDQSSKCESFADSSVSYASAVVSRAA